MPPESCYLQYRSPHACIARIAIITIALSVVNPITTQAADVATRATSSSIGTATAAALPDLGEASDMSASAERRLGDRIARELYRDPDYIEDAVIMEYVQGIWQPLLAAARLRGELPAELDEHFAWEVLLGKDRTVNAFALPGAYLGLHLGLVAVVSSRDELASVLAHELSHVTQRHISRMVARQGEQTPLMVGAMILGILAASKNAQAAGALVVGGQAAAAQSQLNFSRDMEREADRVGFGVSTQAGFAPEGFVSMFAKLEQASRLNDTGGFPYLRSHPLSTERMADMQARLPQIASGGGAGKGLAVAQAVDHAMVSARARVLAYGAVDDLRSWAAESDAAALAHQTPAQQAGSLYGATLAALKLRDFAGASALWARLVAQVRHDAAAARLARLLGVELFLAQGDAVRALALLCPDAVAGATAQSGDAQVTDTHRADLFLLAQAAVQGSQQRPLPVAAAEGLTAATQRLQTWVALHPRDAQAWQTLATVYAAQGRTLGAIRAQAEVDMAQLDYTAAVARFKSAQEWVRSGGPGVDHIEASIVETRLREALSLAREQALER